MAQADWMLAASLPSEVAGADMGGEDVAGRFAEEEQIVAKAVRKRQVEFFAGRACARRALAAFGVPEVPIGQVNGRGPRWPAGFVGSITHCDGYRAAAVARAEDIFTIGIDAEPDAPLPKEVLELVASPSEQQAMAHLRTTDAEVHWDRLLFSAKESVFKAWSPITGEWLGFEDVEVHIDREAGAFQARLLRKPWTLGEQVLSEFAGRWMSGRGLLLTAVVIRR